MNMKMNYICTKDYPSENYTQINILLHNMSQKNTKSNTWDKTIMQGHHKSGTEHVSEMCSWHWSSRRTPLLRTLMLSAWQASFLTPYRCLTLCFSVTCDAAKYWFECNFSWVSKATHWFFYMCLVKTIGVIFGANIVPLSYFMTCPKFDQFLFELGV